MVGGSCLACEGVSLPMNGLVVGAVGSDEWEVWNRKVVGCMVSWRCISSTSASRALAEVKALQQRRRVQMKTPTCLRLITSSYEILLC